MSRDWEKEDRPPPGRPFNRTMPPVDNSLWHQMFTYIKQRGLGYLLAKDNGWYPSSLAGDTSPRIVMPATSGSRENLFWQARAMDDNVKRYQSPAAPRGDAIVVIRPGGTRATAQRGLETAARPRRSLICEGPTDALAAAEFGYYSVSLLGATPSTDVLFLTKKLVRGTILTMMADRDAVASMADLMTFFASDTEAIRLVVPPAPYKDLASMPYGQRYLLLEGV